jgi:hypothetical protein
LSLDARTATIEVSLRQWSEHAGGLISYPFNIDIFQSLELIGVLYSNHKLFLFYAVSYLHDPEVFNPMKRQVIHEEEEK